MGRAGATNAAAQNRDEQQGHAGSDHCIGGQDARGDPCGDTVDDEGQDGAAAEADGTTVRAPARTNDGMHVPCASRSACVARFTRAARLRASQSGSAGTVTS